MISIKVRGFVTELTLAFAVLFAIALLGSTPLPVLAEASGSWTKTGALNSSQGLRWKYDRRMRSGMLEKITDQSRTLVARLLGRARIASKGEPAERSPYTGERQACVDSEI